MRLRVARAYDEEHYAVLCINAPRELANRIAFEFVSQMMNGAPPPDWKTIWPEIRWIEKLGRMDEMLLEKGLEAFEQEEKAKRTGR